MGKESEKIKRTQKASESSSPEKNKIYKGTPINKKQLKDKEKNKSSKQILHKNNVKQKLKDKEKINKQQKEKIVKKKVPNNDYQEESNPLSIKNFQGQHNKDYRKDNNQFQQEGSDNYDDQSNGNKSSQKSQDEQKYQNKLDKNVDQPNDVTFKDLEDIKDIKIKFIHLFNKIQQPYGLVFKQQTRKKLNKIFQNVLKIKFTTEHELDPEGVEEARKIKKQIQQLIIFKKNMHNFSQSDKEFQEYIKNDKQNMIKYFKEASYIFCKEVTHQLYDILRNLCNLVIQFRYSDGEGEKKNILVRKLRQFGDSIVRKDGDYLFFGFNFWPLPQGMNEQDVQQKKEADKDKQKLRYILRPKYRLPGSQYADFAEKAGLDLFDHLKKLSCYKTLKMKN